jgi:uncharacterized protein HemY
MTDKPKIGKNVWDGVLVDGRNATNAARQALDRLIDDQPGPQVTALLIAKVAVQLGKIEAVLNQLDEIGRNANSTKRTLKSE